MPVEIEATDIKELNRRQVIDVREFPEYAAGAIPGSQLVPLGTIETASKQWERNAAIALVCKSGKRAAQAAEKLSAAGFTDLAVVRGGFEAWRAAGQPVIVAQRKPWSLERQVRVIAGTMIVVSTGLAVAVSPWFLLWTGFVGAGLVFAGVTDLCLMATVLGKMPWNRAAAEHTCKSGS